MEKLVYLNHELFAMIDGGISMDLLARLLSTQLLARGEKHLLDRNRLYFRAASADHHPGPGGRSAGARDRTVNELVKAYALWEAGAAVRLVLVRREYSLVAYTDEMTPMFLESFRPRSAEIKNNSTSNLK